MFTFVNIEEKHGVTAHLIKTKYPTSLTFMVINAYYLVTGWLPLVHNSKTQ